jgi:hypothetical protein
MKRIRSEIQESLEIVSKVQIQELRKWEKPAFEFMQMLSLLPQYNTLDDLKIYWNQIVQKT